MDISFMRGLKSRSAAKTRRSSYSACSRRPAVAVASLARASASICANSFETTTAPILALLDFSVWAAARAAAMSPRAAAWRNCSNSAGALARKAPDRRATEAVGAAALHGPQGMQDARIQR